MLNALALALRLLAATPGGDVVAADICLTEWAEYSDGHVACTVGLTTWQCEVQGWCSGGISTVALMPLPSPAWAGQQDWD